MLMNKQNKATAIGFTAIILWSSMVGLIKEVSQAFGATGGAAMIYTIAAIFLLLTVGWIPLRKFPKQYFIWGGLLMVSYEVCLSLAIGHTQNNKQAIDVGMVNYLWPTITMVATIIFNGQKTNWLIIPGALLAMLGVTWVLGGDGGINISEMIINIKSNPFSYGLAFMGAFIWSAYCVITIRISKGINGITPFFIMVAIVMWCKYLFDKESVSMDFNLFSVFCLVLCAAAMGFGYAAWNVGIMKGNVTILTGASYFTPVLSSALSSALLSTSLGFSFWQGAIMVSVGSLLCWFSIKKQKDKNKEII